MVICLAVGCKSDTKQGKAYFFEFPRQENLKQQWLMKIKCRNIQSMQQARMNYAYYVGLNPGWKKMRLQLALNKTFCPNPQPLTQLRLKLRQKAQINKTKISAPLHSPFIGFPHKGHNIKIEKQIKYSILTINELGPPLLESPASISKFYAPTDSEHKFTKTEIENWLPNRIQCGIVLIGSVQS